MIYGKVTSSNTNIFNHCRVEWTLPGTVRGVRYPIGSQHIGPRQEYNESANLFTMYLQYHDWPDFQGRDCPWQLPRPLEINIPYTYYISTYISLFCLYYLSFLYVVFCFCWKSFFFFFKINNNQHKLNSTVACWKKSPRWINSTYIVPIKRLRNLSSFEGKRPPPNSSEGKRPSPNSSEGKHPPTSPV